MTIPKLPKGDPIAYLRRILSAGDVCIDGGANEGTVTEVMAQCVGSQGRVIAVEPDPRCLDKLTERTAAYPQVEVLLKALSDAHGMTPFYQAVQSPQSSRVKGAVREQFASPDPLSVPCTTLDRLVDGPVKAVKLDLQGGETDALDGAWSLLRRCDHWIVEVWPFAIRQSGSTPERFVALFTAAGLQPHAMADGRPTRVSADEVLAWCNQQPLADYQHVNLYFTR